ncbi:COP1-interacting protein 7 isoform X2 [Malania oleifera]|nr:COP1-interacting protein 7 isoform X2 [Malania oleifera]
MAYARALVAGFEMDYIDDLIYFADAFGASRLREACISFAELCKRKNDDGLWMDELAAMRACSRSELSFMGASGIILAEEDNDLGQNITINVHNGGLSGEKQNGTIDASVSDSTTSHGSLEINQDNCVSAAAANMPPTDEKSQVPMSWPSHLPQYLHNYQGPVFQQMPPYHGYVYPGMHGASPYYPGNVQWPPNREDSPFGPDQRLFDLPMHGASSRNKERFSHRKESENLKEDAYRESSESGSESDSYEYLKHNKKHSSIDQVHKKRHGKTSRKVVIRNINYITSKRDGEKGSTSEGDSSDEDDFIDGDSLKQHVEEAVGSFEKHHKTTTHHKKRERSKHFNIVNGSNGAPDQSIESTVANNPGKESQNGSWDAFQSLLMRDEESNTENIERQSVQFHEENLPTKSSEVGIPFTFQMEAEIRKKQAVSIDSFVVTERDTGNEGKTHSENFEPAENIHPVMKKRDSAYEELLFSQRIEGSGTYSSDTVADFATESFRLKSREKEDWFVSYQPDKSANQDESIKFKMFDGNYDSALAGDVFNSVEKKKDVFADDSFMVQTRSAVNEEADSQLRTDIMVTDIVGAGQLENGTTEIPKDKVFGAQEPDDLYMVLERNSAVDHGVTSWTPEMDYGKEISVNETNKRLLDVETTAYVDNNSHSNDTGTNDKKSGVPKRKVPGRETRSKALGGSTGRGKSENVPRSKKPSPGSKTAALKSKSQKEEENRKKMEELLIQRQKRIAERSSANGFKKTPAEDKTAVTSKHEKTILQSPAPDVKKLPNQVIRSSTTDRLAAARINHEASTTQLKSGQLTRTTSKVNGVTDTTIDRLAAARINHKASTTQLKSSQLTRTTSKGNGATDTTIDRLAATSINHEASTTPLKSSQLTRTTSKVNGVTDTTIDHLAAARINHEVSTTQLKSSQLTRTTSKVNGVTDTTVDCLAAAHINDEASTSQLKSCQLTGTTSRINGVTDTTLSQKASRGENKKLNLKKVKSSDQKSGPNNSNSLLTSKSKNDEKKDHMDVTAAMSVELSPAQPIQSSENIRELHSTSSIEKDAGKLSSHMDSFDDKSCTAKLSKRDTSVPTENCSAQLDYLEGDCGVASKASTILCQDKTRSDNCQIIHEVTVEPLPTPAEEAWKIDDDGAANAESPVSPEISEIEISTPPPSNGMNTEPMHSRKKWNSGETSPKAAKGFRRLLLFGRKSR